MVACGTATQRPNAAATQAARCRALHARHAWPGPSAAPQPPAQPLESLPPAPPVLPLHRRLQRGPQRVQVGPKPLPLKLGQRGGPRGGVRLGQRRLLHRQRLLLQAAGVCQGGKGGAVGGAHGGCGLPWTVAAVMGKHARRALPRLPHSRRRRIPCSHLAGLPAPQRQPVTQGKPGLRGRAATRQEHSPTCGRTRPCTTAPAHG